MLVFENVRLLTYKHVPVFTGAGLRYRILKDFSFDGTLLDKHNFGGVESLLDKEDAVLAGAKDYEDIIINGVNFGKGRITNVSFAGGTLVRQEEYTYNIECYEEGDLSMAYDGVYEGIDWSVLLTDRIENISEDFTFSSTEQGDKQFVHSISVQYSKYFSAAEGINLAKNLASMFFNAYSGIGAYVGNLENYHYAKKLYAETYNEIDCSSQFSETIVVPVLTAGNYSYSLNYDVKLDEEGFLTVSEQANIVGLTSSRNSGAEEGYTILSASSYTRSLAVANAYNFSTVNIHSIPIESSRTCNKFSGNIQFSRTYSNNPRYQNSAIWDYDTEINRDEEGVYTVYEKGTITGYGDIGNKYANALAFFKNPVKSGLDARLAAVYASTGRSLPLTLIKQSLEKNEFQGKISYSFTKTDNKLNSQYPYKRVSVETNTSYPTHLNPKFKIFNFKEIIQPQNQSALGQLSVNIELKGSRATTKSQYLEDAKNIAADYIPENDSFLQECNYSYTPNANQFEFKADFVFVRAKEAFDLTLN